MILSVDFPWDSIKFVTSGLTLVAFIAAGALYAWKLKLDKTKEALKSVPESDMAGLLKSLAERYDLPVEGLPPTEVAAQIREELAVRERLTRQRMNLFALCAVLFTFLAGFSIYMAAQPPTNVPSGPNVSVIQLPATLTWRQAVVIACDAENVTADFSAACDSVFPLSVKGGKIDYVDIANLINIITLRIEGRGKHTVTTSPVQANIVQISCQ